MTPALYNEGHHWQATNGGFLAEWWPSSATLVLNSTGMKGFIAMPTNRPSRSYNEPMRGDSWDCLNNSLRSAS